jgi:hypothetical protein
MFQICVPDKKNLEKKKNVTFLNFFKNAMIKNKKYTISLILLSFQNLWNLINLFTEINENVHLNVSYDFSKFDGSKKMKV